VVELQSNAHEVDMFTPHHDPKRCFEETLEGELYVRVFFVQEAVGNLLLKMSPRLQSFKARILEVWWT
jgi:hypothetical protein